MPLVGRGVAGSGWATTHKEVLLCCVAVACCCCCLKFIPSLGIFREEECVGNEKKGCLQRMKVGMEPC